MFLVRNTIAHTQIRYMKCSKYRICSFQTFKGKIPIHGGSTNEIYGNVVLSNIIQNYFCKTEDIFWKIGHVIRQHMCQRKFHVHLSTNSTSLQQPKLKTKLILYTERLSIWVEWNWDNVVYLAGRPVNEITICRLFPFKYDIKYVICSETFSIFIHLPEGAVQKERKGHF